MVLLAIWMPIALPIYWYGDDPNRAAIVAMAILYGEFIALIRVWGRYVYAQPRLLVRYGLVWTQANLREALVGLAIGVSSLLLLFGIEGILGWVTWNVSNGAIARVAFEGIAVALGVGFAEELVFRGWVLDELQRDYRPAIAHWTNAAIFALLHFIKPLAEILRTGIQFPGLIGLGIALVWAKQWGNGRLGLPIGLHAGLVWGYYLVNVGKLVRYSDGVPSWVTGIDGNPLAGVMGLLFLGAIAFWMRWNAVRVAPKKDSI